MCPYKCHCKCPYKCPYKCPCKCRCKCPCKFNKTEKSILKLIGEKNEITHKEIAKILEVTEKTARKNTQNLRNKMIIERIGSDKNGYWKRLR